MSEKYNGGPAFPVSPRFQGHHQDGMSLRDWFAGQALASCIVLSEAGSSLVPNSTTNQVASYAASLSYLVADAMIAEREK